MRILAIDPGSALGWATDATGRLEFGEEGFGIRNGESSGNRWRRFGEWLNDVTESSHGRAPIALIVYERSVFAPKARAAAEIAAGFTTRLEEHCERHGIALQPVAPATLKKYATGKGNADKDKMIASAMRRLTLDVTGTPLGLVMPHPLTSNEADALWLYWYGKEVLSGNATHDR